MATKCRSRILMAGSILCTIPDDGIQTDKAKMIYTTLLACSRNLWNFWSKMTMEHNMVNTELRVAENAIAFVKVWKQTQEIGPMVKPISHTQGVNFL
ncbi:MAG: hypothetical protein M3129_02170 [Thermoproteota archaeon]|nr:hypothetical protein [Thermoproteota archaeon]